MNFIERSPNVFWRSIGEEQHAIEGFGPQRHAYKMSMDKHAVNPWIIALKHFQPTIADDVCRLGISTPLEEIVFKAFSLNDLSRLVNLHHPLHVSVQDMSARSRVT